MSRFILGAVAAALTLAVGAAWAEPLLDHRAAAMGLRLFPTLTSRQMAQVEKLAPIERMLGARRQRMESCGELSRCWFKAALWTDDERALLVNAAAQRSAPFSGSDDGVAAQISREILGLNKVLRVYGLGAPPTYPEIDGPDDPDGRRATVALRLSRASSDDPTSSLDPSVELSLALLDVNKRDDAAAFEPIDAGLNGPAFYRAQSVDWSRYTFTAIIVLGAGPDDLATPLSARSKTRLRVAAQQFEAGKAPFIIVTGGAVHPRGTTYVEAVQMRRALIERFQVPVADIVIDPYARHTTTNLRNAARLLAELKAPSGRPALIVSDKEHIDSIVGADFANRNQQELGYQPGVVGRRLSDETLIFRPSKASSRVDPADPLDP